PTPWTFLVLRHSLATIIGHIVHHFQRVRSHAHYDDVVRLDEELQRFMNKLPPHYAVENTDTSLDLTHPYIPVHRFIIITEVFFVRISLHRPYLLRRLTSEKYGLSRRACFESAKQEYKIRQHFKQTMPADVIRALGGAYREFQAAMIAGIGLMLDPVSPDAAELHEILDGFLRDHEGLHETDATTRREMKIIEFLKKKAEAGPEEGGFSGISRAKEGQVQAQANASLLMGLSGQQSFGHPMSNHRSSPHSTGQKAVLPSLQQPIFQGIQSTPSPRSPMDSGFSPHHGRHPSRGGHSTNSTGGFTPPNEEAQSLLDNWCNSVINSSGFGAEASGTTDFTSPWLNAPTPAPYVFTNAPRTDGMMDVEGGAPMTNGYEDWTYWEGIVSAIGRDGVN
ncbi:11289_t:CDS:1, partial [Acaulospora colombiana]